MPTLILICALPGAGKTTLAKQIESSRQALRLCPDDWIKAVIKDETDKPELDRLRDPVEQLQWKLGQRLLVLGSSIILENGFWSREERDRFRSQAEALGASVELHYLEVPKEELWLRIEQRNTSASDDFFKITREELELWWSWFEPPEQAELQTYDAFHVHR